MEASGRWLNDFISMLLGKLKIEFIMLLGNKIKSLRDEKEYCNAKWLHT